MEVNYVHLAFSYFDRGHCGLMPCDDLQALLNATGFPLSRKVYNGLTSACEGPSSEKAIAYREFTEPSGPLVERPPVYPTVLSSNFSSSSVTELVSEEEASNSTSSSLLIVERNGVQYNVDQLIRQATEDQKAKVEMSEHLLKTTAKLGKLF